MRGGTRWPGLALAVVLGVASGCGGGSTSSEAEDDLRKRVAELEAEVERLRASTTVSTTAPASTSPAEPATAPTSAPPTTVAPPDEDLFGGLRSVAPVGDAGAFSEWRFPLPGPSTVVVPVAEDEEAPWTSYSFTMAIDDPAVSFDELQAYLRAVPGQQGWDARFEWSDGQSSHDIGTWSFFSADDLFVAISLFDAPMAPEGAAPQLLVSYTYADG